MNISSAKTEIKPTFNKVTFNEFESQLAVYKDKLNNIDEIMSMSDIDGVLVGGASLDPKNFARIANYQA